MGSLGVGRGIPSIVCFKISSQTPPRCPFSTTIFSISLLLLTFCCDVESRYWQYFLLILQSFTKIRFSITQPVCSLLYFRGASYAPLFDFWHSYANIFPLAPKKEEKIKSFSWPKWSPFFSLKLHEEDNTLWLLSECQNFLSFGHSFSLISLSFITSLITEAVETFCSVVTLAF